MAMKKYSSVDQWLEDQDRWQTELARLREILLSTGLSEELKWSLPNYLHGKKLVVGIAGFQNHFGLWFYQGALLSDPAGVLVNAQEGKTRAMRQWRMTSKKEIRVRTIKAYVREAVEWIDCGVEIKPQPKGALVIPPELANALSKNPDARARFERFAPSCQREFAEYIAEAKRDDTKQRRIEKILPMILDQTGLNDRYRK